MIRRKSWISSPAGAPFCRPQRRNQAARFRVARDGEADPTPPSEPAARSASLGGGRRSARRTMDTSPIATFALEPDPPRGPGGGSVGLGSAGAAPRESLDEARLSALLVELAGEASALRFEVAPNPCVGAAILSRGEVIGRGVHRVCGVAPPKQEPLAGAGPSDVPR